MSSARGIKRHTGRADEPERATAMADEPGDPQQTAKRLGGRIREIRKGMNMTGRALAKACDITPGFVSQMENGTVLPSIPTLMRVAAELRVRPSELLQP